ncbi:WDTC1 [Mytilus coruscus]|uniref:RING-type E3 ubiquitin transferase n=1 Tax=Mytilus coruscus TaxID=42192 RepID=A0A6J8DXA5_MYTCO|nr:WDTC1 [Mytilus coruscus]
MHQDSVHYLIAGHLPQKQKDCKTRYRTLASTYLTFSPDGTQLLVNLGGEQIYLFDVNSQKKAEKFDISLILAQNGVVKEAACTNGFSVHKNGTTNGVANGVQAAAAAVMKAELEVEAKYRSKKASSYFEKEHYSKAIYLYNQAIARASYSSVLFGNRAVAYMKRKWDGDLYAALRDCHSALQLDPNHLQAHFRLARCLSELSWPQEAYDCLQQFKNKCPDYAKSNACEALDKDISAAIRSNADEKDPDNSVDPQAAMRKKSFPISDQENHGGMQHLTMSQGSVGIAIQQQI